MKLKKKKIKDEIVSLIEKYSNIEIDDKNDIYQSLCKKGRDTVKNFNLDNLYIFLRYCNAALYDFTGKVNVLNVAFKSFLITSALFMVLAPQYLGFILPLIFVLPIYFAIKGLKVRSYNGFILMLSVLPMGLLTSVIWIKNAILAFKSGNIFFEELSKYYNMDVSSARNLFILFVFLSVILLFSSIYTFYIGVKNRKMFV